MRMKIPQPIQLWFNEFNTKVSLTGKHGVVKNGKFETSSFLLKQKSNPLLLIGVNTLILDTITSYPPNDGASDVLRIICNQLVTFFRASDEEIRNLTLELLPSVLFVYLYFQQRASQLTSTRGKTLFRNPTTTYNDSQPVSKDAYDKREIIEIDEDEESSANTRKAKSYTKQDNANDTLLIVQILENFLVEIYNCCNESPYKIFGEEKTNSTYQQGLFATPTVFNDPMYINDTSCDRTTTTKARQNTAVENNYNRLYDISWKGLEKQTNMEANIDRISEHNRMLVLSRLLQTLNQFHSELPEFALHSLCLIAILSSPRQDQRQNAFKLRLCCQQTSDQDLSNNILFDEHQETKKTKSEDYSRKKLSNKAEFDKNLTTEQHSLASTPVGSKFTRRASRGGHQHTVISHKKTDEQITCSRINGLSETFVMELLVSLQSTMSRSLPNLLRLAMESLESRANFELWSKALLVINSMKHLTQLPRTFTENATSFVNQEEPRQIDAPKERSHSTYVNPMPINPEQMSLASAYCSLWAELVEKRDREGLKPTYLTTVTTPKGEPVNLKLVQVARDKFMSSIVTNANFQTSKPPDDIPIHSEQVAKTKPEPLPRSTSFTHTSQSNQNSDSWVQGIEDLKIDDNPTLSNPRDWFKKAFVPRRNANKL